MNPVDPFEERLRRTPFREPPASLREEVLSSLRSAPARLGAGSTRAGLAPWNRPLRLAWAGLGFAWLLILLINLAALQMGGSAPAPRVEPWASPAFTAALHEQRVLRNRLLQEPAPGTLPSKADPGARIWRDRRMGRWIV